MAVETKVAHTPGPWHVIDSYRGATENYKRTHPRDLLIDSYRGATSICDVASIPTTSPQAIHDRELANANVLAAAPDLLRAVDAALGYIVSRGDLREGTEASSLQTMLRAAIAKAEGR